MWDPESGMTVLVRASNNLPDPTHMGAVKHRTLERIPIVGGHNQATSV